MLNLFIRGAVKIRIKIRISRLCADVARTIAIGNEPNVFRADLTAHAPKTKNKRFATPSHSCRIPAMPIDTPNMAIPRYTPEIAFDVTISKCGGILAMLLWSYGFQSCAAEGWRWQ